MEMDVVFAIASHKRPEMLQRHTLSMLRRHSIDMKHVHVFASAVEDYMAISHQLGFHLHIGGKEGITQARNDIIQHFAHGQHIVELDDDVEDIVQFNGKTSTPIQDLQEFINVSFAKIGTEGLWGICATANAFYASGKDQFGPRSIINSFLGYINNKNIVLTVTEKEDFQRVCQFHALGLPVLKRGTAGVVTRYWYNPGGIQNRRSFQQRKVAQRESADALMALYPGMFRMQTRRNGITDIFFVPKRTGPRTEATS